MCGVQMNYTNRVEVQVTRLPIFVCMQAVYVVSLRYGSAVGKDGRICLSGFWWLSLGIQTFVKTINS